MIVLDECGTWRFIPAGAGNARVLYDAQRMAPVHPRGCGERLISRWRLVTSRGSSPRVRGTPSPSRYQPGRTRFIPAGAGNARSTTPLSGCRAVHPRGCGERKSLTEHEAAMIGSSPRVRGTREDFVNRG